MRRHYFNNEESGILKTQLVSQSSCYLHFSLSVSLFVSYYYVLGFLKSLFVCSRFVLAKVIPILTIFLVNFSKLFDWLIELFLTKILSSSKLVFLWGCILSLIQFVLRFKLASKGQTHNPQTFQIIVSIWPILIS
jgi:hypothetical protein